MRAQSSQAGHHISAKYPIKQVLPGDPPLIVSQRLLALASLLVLLVLFVLFVLF